MSNWLARQHRFYGRILTMLVVLFVAALILTAAVAAVNQGAPAPPPRFLFPPHCIDKPAEGIRVCVSWDPYSHDFVEVWRGPSLTGALRLRDAREDGGA